MTTLLLSSPSHSPLSHHQQQQPSSSGCTILTTITQKIQHVDLEMCTVGGSIEHRLWPAATFLTSYILSNNNDDSNDSCSSHHKRHHHNSTTDPTNQKIHQNVQTILDHFRCVIATNSRTSINDEGKGLKVLELGAGIGFTSLELAYHAFQNICEIKHQKENDTSRSSIEFLMTDLASALPLLQRNQQRNFGNNNNDNAKQNSFICVQKLEWGNHDDITNAISWYRNVDNNHNNNNTNNEVPLLILGTDCVYWESLHDILETTIASLLQAATPNSICLLANVRRWKRDTNFFQSSKFGHFSSNSHGRLRCICLHEQVSRHGQEQQQREVIRIYAVQWIAKDGKQQK